MKEIPIQTIYDQKSYSSHFRAVADSIIIYSDIIKFALSSLTAFAIDFLLLMAFNKLFAGFGSEKALLASVICARIISSLFNFFTNRKLVFKHQANLKKAMLEYYTLAGVILAFNYLFMYFWNIMLNIPLAVSKIITEGILFTLSYIVQKSLVFKNYKQKEDLR